LEYTNYQFIASRLHRRFKKAFYADPDKSHEEYKELIKFIEAGFKKLCGDQAEYIQKYFYITHLSKEWPRVGIHAVSDEDEVLDVIMIPSVEIGRPKKLEEYSAFLEVYSTGLPYLNNNIPKTAKHDDNYMHKGLSVGAIKENYKPKMSDCKLISRWRNNIFKSVAPDCEWGQMTNNGGKKAICINHTL